MRATITATARSPQDAAIVAVAVALGEDLDATISGDAVSRVFIFDCEARNLIGTFVLPFFGEPSALAVMLAPKPLIIAARYYEWGVGAFDLAGNLAWHRKDLKKASSILPIANHPAKPRVAVELEKLASRFLNAADGREAAFPAIGASNIHCSPDGRLGFCLARKKMMLISLETKQALFSLPTERDIDSVGFSPTALLLSWRDWNGTAKGSHMECVDFSGRALWKVDFPREWYGHLYWDNANAKWLSVGSHYRHIGGDELAVICPESGAMELRPLPLFDLHGVYPCNGESQFIAGGSLMLHQGCRILRVPSLELVLDLIPIFEAGGVPPHR
ncbi:MAG TPA: hypothetical protein VGP72_05925 [Planctomycetota bacterium]|jgi:hypothetical protein